MIQRWPILLLLCWAGACCALQNSTSQEETLLDEVELTPLLQGEDHSQSVDIKEKDDKGKEWDELEVSAEEYDDVPENPVVEDYVESADEKATSPLPKRRTTLVATSTQPAPILNTENPDTSAVCNLCRCSALEASPFIIDCSVKEQSELPLDSDWPKNSLITAMDVNFGDNRFSELLSLSALSIRRLSFRGNTIQAIEKAAFVLLSQMDELDLSENELSHESLPRQVFQGPFVAGEFEPIPLKTLRLGYNRIRSLDMDALDHLPYLEVLELNNNPLPVLDRPTEMTISSLRKLKVLNLAETTLESIPDGFLHALHSLEVLLLNGNRLTTVPAELRRSPGLQLLNLNDNPIQRLNASSFEGVSGLRQLNISAMNRLESIDENTFSGLKSLTSLWCSFNPSLKRIHSRAFMGIAADKENLVFSEFRFRGNAVPFVPRNLLPWSDLEIIDVQENPFVCDCSSGWMIQNLIPLLEEELTLSLICSAPEEYAGQSISSLVDVKSIQNCSNPPMEGHWTDGEDILPLPPKMYTGFSARLLILYLFGIMFIIIGVSVLVMMFVRKRHLRQMYDQTTGQIVHYVRTVNPKNQRDDEEAILYRQSTYSEVQ